MNTIETLNFIGEDTRKRKFLLPTSIVKTNGNVCDAEKLLQNKDLQIGLSEPEVTVLENGADGENASVVLDYGCELHGGIRIISAFNKGEKPYPLVRLTFGESLTEVESMIGEDTSTNDHAARQFIIPVPRLSDQEWGQTGFRFVKLELLDKNIKLQLKTVPAVFVYRDYEYKGSFECDDELVNRIYQTAVYTCHLCLQNMVWDGIKRDRLVWIGDMMIETMTTRSVFGDVDIVPKSLEFVRDQTPLPGWMNNMPSYSMWWILILHDWYMSTGNEAFLNRQKDYLTALLDMLCAQIKPNGDDTVGSYFLDWPTEADSHKVWGVRSLLKMSLEAGAVLAEHFKETKLVQKCREAINNLNKKKGDCGGRKQIAAVMSLAGDMDSSVAADIITENGVSGFSTFMGYHLLAALAADCRYGDALSMMKQYYKGMLDKGATTFWEDCDYSWLDGSSTLTDKPCQNQSDIHGDFGAYCYKGFRHSFCHGWAAGPVPYLTETVLGIKALEPGCKKIAIKPHLDGLNWVKGTFPTPFGIVKVSHERQPDGSIKTQTTAPKEVEIVTE